MSYYKSQQNTTTDEHTHCKSCGAIIKKVFGRKASHDYFPEYCERCSDE